MRDMRYLFLSALLTALPMFSRADDGVALLLNNGSTVTFTFSERPSIATADVISISTPAGVSVQYAYGDVQRVYWADVAASGIGTAETRHKSDVSISFAGGGIEVCGLAAGATGVQGFCSLPLFVSNGKSLNFHKNHTRPCTELIICTTFAP